LSTAIDREAAVTTFFLVRHGAHGLLGRVLVGCSIDVSLDELGRRQAQALAERFSRERVDAVQTSPRRRCRQTALPIAGRIGVPARIVPAVDEIDCGEWSGRTFDELGDDPRWTQWNASRATARAPGGESMAEVQLRIVGHLERMQSIHPAGRIVIVSHCDVIRAALLHCRDEPLDCYGQISFGPAAVATLELDAKSRGPITVEEAIVA
jgi:broad specificity phosphatase PhoE